MCRENPGWGRPRIHGELLKLGFPIRREHREQVHGSLLQAAVRDLAHIPAESSLAAGLHDFLTVPTLGFLVHPMFYLKLRPQPKAVRTLAGEAAVSQIGISPFDSPAVGISPRRNLN
jgi:hypothetical protein